ncbi:MAG: SGNH/GDSL hydrolase family protein, partial [Gemmatimonadaceae bacterium]|nr:SGNH/GDSL hydrolase family protein [Gemmatimonadaceae bacterium]
MTASPGPFARYVAIGDSSTEGLDDPMGGGRYRGWADRFAEHVAEAQSSPLLYANLAIRGRKANEVRAEQLAAALAMRPDLATVFAGTNDVLRRRVDLDGVAHELGTMQRALRGLGATVLTITVPDLSAVTPLGALVRDRVLALNARLRATAEETGTLMVDLAAHPVTGDPRLWSEDRLHANSEGHRRIASALAARLGLAGAGDEWALPLPARAPR